jgi:hypothetical protein
MTRRICCREIIGQARSLRSPFTRLVATGYYDGPTEGQVECGACGRLHVFRLVDWGEGQDLRQFSLAPTPCSFGDIESSTPARARWRTVTVVRGDADDPDGAVEKAMNAASAVEFVVATRDLLALIETWRPAG